MNSLLAAIVASGLGATPEPAAHAEPAPAPHVEPAPAPAPAPQAEPAPYGTDYHYEPAPPSAPPPSAPPPSPAPPTQTGLGMLVAGPLIIAAGVPFSFLGNRAWRLNCGPTNTTRECFDGSTGSIAGHTFTGIAYGTGIALTAVGGARRGQYDAHQDPHRDSTGFIVGGAVMLPMSLIGMGMVRLLMWLPTPDCQTASCVAQYQNLSTGIVGGLALTASVGAGLLMYGVGYKRRQARVQPPFAVLPQVGRGFAGLGLTGQF